MPVREPTPKEVKALRVDVVRQAKQGVREFCSVSRAGIWLGARGYRGEDWVAPEVRMVRYLILKDLQKLEYELRHGIGRRMPKGKKVSKK